MPVIFDSVLFALYRFVVYIGAASPEFFCSSFSFADCYLMPSLKCRPSGSGATVLRKEKIIAGRSRLISVVVLKWNESFWEERAATTLEVSCRKFSSFELPTSSLYFEAKLYGFAA